MDPTSITTQIAQTDFNLGAFVQLILADEAARAQVVDHMLHHPHIMVYLRSAARCWRSYWMSSSAAPTRKSRKPC